MTDPSNLPRPRDMAQLKVLVRRQGALAIFELNRPTALNAFDDEMRQILAEEIPRIARNPDIYIVALTSSNTKAFCAGGDVKALTQLARTDIEAVKGYFKNEYSLDWLLDCFSKPSVSFINGLCMGSGAGLSCYNTHRIAGDGYKWAMPETAIGLFPDVGVAHVLARLPWPMGLYLGLTGRTVNRGDAVWLGLATHAIAASQHDGIMAQLADCEPVDPLLDRLHEPQPPGPLQQEFSSIQAYFSGDSLADIVRELEGATGSSQQWAAQQLAELRRKSPVSLAITDRHIRSARNLDLRETLIQDCRLAVRCLEAHDFYEGVRAALVDKDQKPIWRPQRLEDVTADMVSSYFAPIKGGELNLPSRDEMQAARV